VTESRDFQYFKVVCEKEGGNGFLLADTKGIKLSIQGSSQIEPCSSSEPDANVGLIDEVVVGEVVVAVAAVIRVGVYCYQKKVKLGGE
jgi:hypothetical protein